MSIRDRIIAEAERQFDSLVELQRDLHAHPEIGYEENRTAARLAEEMRALGLEVRTGLAYTGVTGTLSGGRDGAAVAVRADMDAFPIEEAEGLPWRSQNAGAAHVCGHDAHTAIVVGVARVLTALRGDLAGRVRFIFQPAEERPLVQDEEERPYWEGVRAVPAAQLMVNAGVLRNPDIQAVYGLHLWPWLPAGQIGIEEGPAMAGVANFRARVLGKGAHGAAPHSGVDAIAAMAQIIGMLQLIVSRQTDPSEPLVVTVGTIRGGDRRNVIADRVDITGTVRCVSAKVLRQDVPRQMRAIIAGVTEALGADYVLEYDPVIGPTMNDPALAEAARRAVAGALGDGAVVPALERAMTGEDFSRYAEAIPGLYMKVGCTTPGQPLVPLHNRAFVFDPAAIRHGVIALASAVVDKLGSSA
ncbi:MAG: M20 metallopeptidase family protein [Anaerolineae bacterium]